MKLILVILVFLNHISVFAKVAFGVYLLRDSSINAIDAANIGLNNLKLSDDPLWSLRDFEYYKCTGHEFKLKQMEINKMPKGSLKGLPFVFIANNLRIYLGAFWTSFSSFSFGYPVIDTELFKATGDLKIMRAYPHDGFAIGDDPRSSLEIIYQFKKNHILRDSCP